jgi:hypothetical protein
MVETRPLEVVFLTNFADFCYRSIPAIAQMADDFPVRLTIVHSTMDRTPSIEDRIKLESFFPEADAYAHCRRMALRGDPVDAVKRLSMTHPVDLLVAPAADPLGLPRLWHRSLRTRLLREARIPLWTMDRRTPPAKLRRGAKRVGCWLDFHRAWSTHVAFAREYAMALGAELHVLHALQEVSDGMIAFEDQPVTKAGVIETASLALGRSSVPTQFHVAESDGRRSRMKLIEQAGVDVVFAADVPLHVPEWIAPKPRLMNEGVCPVVHVPVDTPVAVWSLANARRAAVPELTVRLAGTR